MTDEEPREANRMNRDSWKRAAVGGAGGIFPHVDGVNYTPAYCFDIVVNGQLFHDDAEKAAHFERLNDMQQAYVLVNVNGILTEALNILRAERNLIWAAFERGAVTV